MPDFPLDPKRRVQFVMYQRAYPTPSPNLCLEVYDADSGEQLSSRYVPARSSKGEPDHAVTMSELSAMFGAMSRDIATRCGITAERV